MRDMRLLHRYLKPKRASEVQTVFIADERRVAIKGALYDLRTTAKLGRTAAQGFAPDGAWVEWNAQELLLKTPEGTSKLLHGYEGLSTLVKAVTDEVVVLQADGRQPLLVIDRATGRPIGRLQGQIGEVFGTTVLFNGLVFVSHDGQTLWLTEAGRIAQFDLETRQPLKEFSPQDDEKYLGLAVHESGAVLTIARRKEHGFDTTHDQLVLIKPGGVQKRVKRTFMSLGALTDGFVAFEPAKKQFVFFNLKLEETGTLAHDGNWVQIHVLPSRREWLSVGGTGGVDHHGDDALAPEVDETPAPPPAPKKAKKKAPVRKKK